MSKFHVGDEVTLHFTEEQLEQFALDSEVNLDLSGKWTVKLVYTGGFQGETYYRYSGQMYSVSNGSDSWDVPEEVLRPAKIEALPVAVARDSVNHPAHYTRFPVEVIEITEQLDFCLGNVVEYVCRAGYKDGSSELEDLNKAKWYLERKISQLEKP